MSKRVDLLAIDIDGTLLDDQRSISPQNRAAIARATAQGVTVVLASGRFAPSIAPFARDLGLGPTKIGANGAHIVGSTGQDLFYRGLSRQVTAQVVRFAEENALHLNAYTRHEILFLQETPWSELYRDRVREVRPRLATPGEILTTRVTKLLYILEPDALPTVRARIEPAIEPAEAVLAESEREYLEFMPAGVNKGAALKILAESLGIPQARTAAIGDYLNDLEMLEWAGISAAVENAPDQVKQVAKCKVSSNIRDGVAEFIEQFVLD